MPKVYFLYGGRNEIILDRQCGFEKPFAYDEDYVRHPSNFPNKKINYNHPLGLLYTHGFSS